MLDADNKACTTEINRLDFPLLNDFNKNDIAK
jgi:hypothetical protein